MARWWRRALGLALLAALVLTAGLSDLVAILGRMAPGWALGAVVLSCGWMLLGGLNVWILLRRLAPVPLPRFVTVYVISWASALLLPGQLGDATQVVLLRRHGVPAAKSGAAYVADKAVSLGWLVLVTVYGVYLYGAGIPGVPLLAVFAAAAVVATGAALAVLRRVAAAPGTRVARLKRLLGHLEEQLRAFRSYPGTLALNVVLTILKWILMAWIYRCAFEAFGQPLAFEAVATLPAMSSLVGHLPVTVGGAGTTEWSAVFLFGRLGVGAATVVSVYLFLRCALIAVGLLLLLLCKPSAAGGVDFSHREPPVRRRRCARRRRDTPGP